MDIYGIIGWPIKHSRSPAMHNAAFKELGIDAEYRKFPVRPEGLEDFLLKRKDVRGFNITIPHKVTSREILEKRFAFDENASWTQQDLYYIKVSGAINTVDRVGEGLRYWNTDASGFLESLDRDLQFSAKGKEVLVIGCGGAGRSVIAGLSWKGVQVKKIYVYDINYEAINSTKEHFSKLLHDLRDDLERKTEFITETEIPDRIKRCQLLVNASSAGMKEENASVIGKKFLHKDLFVYDLVYNRETRLIKDAGLLGLYARGGLGMLLYQGARSFELWTGKRAPIELMRSVLR